MSRQFHFDLKRPCAHCPFVNTAERTPLTHGRAVELVSAIRDEGKTFVCHETSDSLGSKSVHDQQCAGVMLLVDKEKGLAGHSLFRIAMFLKILDPANLDRTAPVFASFEAFTEANKET